MAIQKNKAKASLVAAEVIWYFKEVDALPADDKSALIRVIAGFIRDVKIKQAFGIAKAKSLFAIYFKYGSNSISISN